MVLPGKYDDNFSTVAYCEVFLSLELLKPDSTPKTCLIGIKRKREPVKITMQEPEKRFKGDLGCKRCPFFNKCRSRVDLFWCDVGVKAVMR